MSMEEADFTVYEDGTERIDIIRRAIESRENFQNFDDAFHLMDVGYHVRAVDQWREQLPGVMPFYAVKVNPDPVLLGILAKLDFGFDCASKSEIEMVIAMGVSPRKIVYANTRKQLSHLRYAASVGVELTVFDDSDELLKIKENAPNMKLLLRLATKTTPDPGVAMEFMSVKFGCPHEDTEKVLGLAKELRLNVIGVCFHNGFSTKSLDVWAHMIRDAKRVFQEARDLGFNMTMLDIGGSQPPNTVVGAFALEFEEVAGVIRNALDDNFGKEDKVRVIAEPGSFFSIPSAVLIANIIGKRHRGTRDHQTPDIIEYFINDGIFSSFAFYGILLADTNPVVMPVSRQYEDASSHRCCIWGQTMSGEVVIRECRLPNMKTGDWLYFPDMGGYSASLFSTFNGFQKRPVYHYITESSRKRFDEIVSEGGLGHDEQE